MALKKMITFEERKKELDEFKKPQNPSTDILEQIYTDPIGCINSEEIVNLIHDNGWYGSAICQAMGVDNMILSSKKHPDGFKCSIGIFKELDMTVLDRIKQKRNGVKLLPPHVMYQKHNNNIKQNEIVSLEGISMKTDLPAKEQRKLMLKQGIIPLN